MNPLSSNLFRVAAFAVALPILGICAPILPATQAAIQVNAVCYVGNCDSPGSIGAGQSSSGTFSFLYTFADGDQYSISGSYDNSYPPQLLAFKPTVTYLNNFGNMFTPSVQTDVLSLDMKQDFYDPTGDSWDGQYCENIPFTVTTMASANGNAYFDGNGIGFLNGQTGSSDPSQCTNLTFTAAQNADPTMHTEFLLDFTFYGGNLSGATIYSHMPEPVQTIPVALGLVAFGSIAIRRKRNKS